MLRIPLRMPSYNLVLPDYREYCLELHTPVGRPLLDPQILDEVTLLALLYGLFHLLQ